MFLNVLLYSLWLWTLSENFQPTVLYCSVSAQSLINTHPKHWKKKPVFKQQMIKLASYNNFWHTELRFLLITLNQTFFFAYFIKQHSVIFQTQTNSLDMKKEIISTYQYLRCFLPENLTFCVAFHHTFLSISLNFYLWPQVMDSPLYLLLCDHSLILFKPAGWYYRRLKGGLSAVLTSKGPFFRDVCDQNQGKFSSKHLNNKK